MFNFLIDYYVSMSFLGVYATLIKGSHHLGDRLPFR